MNRIPFEFDGETVEIDVPTALLAHLAVYFAQKPTFEEVASGEKYDFVEACCSAMNECVREGTLKRKAGATKTTNTASTPSGTNVCLTLLSCLQSRLDVIFESDCNREGKFRKFAMSFATTGVTTECILRVDFAEDKYIIERVSDLGLFFEILADENPEPPPGSPSIAIEFLYDDSPENVKKTWDQRPEDVVFTFVNVHSPDDELDDVVKLIEKGHIYKFFSAA